MLRRLGQPLGAVTVSNNDESFAAPGRTDAYS